jgi:hypothetical protein
MKRAALITTMALMGPLSGTALAAGSHSPAQHRPTAAALATHVSSRSLSIPGSAHRVTKLAGRPSAQPTRQTGPGRFRAQLYRQDTHWLEWMYSGRPGYWWAVYYSLDGGVYDYAFQYYYYSATGSLSLQPYAFIYYADLDVWTQNLVALF